MYSLSTVSLCGWCLDLQIPKLFIEPPNPSRSYRWQGVSAVSTEPVLIHTALPSTLDMPPAAIRPLPKFSPCKVPPHLCSLSDGYLVPATCFPFCFCCCCYPFGCLFLAAAVNWLGSTYVLPKATSLPCTLSFRAAFKEPYSC